MTSAQNCDDGTFRFFATTAMCVCMLASCSSSNEAGRQSQDLHPVVANEPINSLNAEKWKKNVKYDREKSVHDLVDRKLLTDLTEKKVFELLGAPDSKEGTHWDYEIRPESASFETLFVYFENGKVVKYELKANP